MLVAWTGGVAAPPGRGTPLLETDLRAGTKVRIDQTAKDAIDAEMDAVLSRAGARSEHFSTRELEVVEQRLLAELKKERPRATPHIIVFLYPGRITPERLKVLSEIYVDVEILIDPCERAVCRDAVARHIELVGRAVGRPERRSRQYTLIFKTLVIRTKTQYHDAVVEEYRVSMGDAVASAAVPSGGKAWLDRMSKMTEQFEPIVAKGIARHAAERRVALVGVPQVSRQADAAHAVVTIRADRVRVQSQVTQALCAAVLGFRDNPATPSAVTVEVRALVPMKGTKERRFQCMGQPILAFLDGKLGERELFGSYVREAVTGRGVTTMSFDEEEAARGGAAQGGSEGPTLDDAVGVLTQHFGKIRACVRAELSRNPRFQGTSISFRWLPSGRAADVQLKEHGLRGGPLERCVADVLSGLSLPRFAGEPREVHYPLRVKREP